MKLSAPADPARPTTSRTVLVGTLANASTGFVTFGGFLALTMSRQLPKEIR